MRALSLMLSAALMSLAGGTASAQTADRTIDEIKAETLARAQTGAYPALGIAPADATDALGRISTRDPDEWAAAWSAVADGYMAKAKAASDLCKTPLRQFNRLARLVPDRTSKEPVRQAMCGHSSRQTYPENKVV